MHARLAFQRNPRYPLPPAVVLLNSTMTHDVHAKPHWRGTDSTAALAAAELAELAAQAAEAGEPGDAAARSGSSSSKAASGPRATSLPPGKAQLTSQPGVLLMVRCTAGLDRPAGRGAAVSGHPWLLAAQIEPRPAAPPPPLSPAQRRDCY
jgi:hypothetical protein